MINDNLEQLAKEYVNDVNRACDMMLEGIKLSSKENLIKLRLIQPSGEFYLDGNNRYTFHGRGCRFLREDLNIDWDFGCENICEGIDPWKLAYYIRDNKNFNTLYDGNSVKEVLEELIAEGKMVKKFDLYYFT